MIDRSSRVFTMKAKSSAHYQREFRRRMREQGLVKKEVWILPGNAKQLTAIEKMLRQEDLPGQLKLLSKTSKGGVRMENVTPWTTATLLAALSEEEIVRSGQAEIELIEGAEPSLLIIMKEYGDLPVFMTVAGEQIIVECVLWSTADVRDPATFNEAVLRTHKYFPLSTISLDTIDGDGDYYHMFGALSATSILANVVFEIEVLATNVIQATEAYGEYLIESLAEEA